MSRVLHFCLATALAVSSTSVVAQQRTQSYEFLEAVRKGDGDKVTGFLNQPGQLLINSKDRTSGDGALHIVAGRNDGVYLRFLLSKGADPYGNDGGPIGLAAYFDMLGAFKDVNLNTLDTDGVPVCLYAFAFLGTKACRRLLDAGVVNEPEGARLTLLHGAAETGNRAALEALLDAGVDPDCYDEDGRTPLFNAIGADPCVKLLLERGAHPDAQDDDGATPLMAAGADAASARVLLKGGADVDATDDRGMTALHHLAAALDEDNRPIGRVCVAELFLEKGADPLGEDIAGHTPLDLAEAVGNKSVARFLRKTVSKK